MSEVIGTVTFTVKAEITAEMVEDMLITAFEGGSPWIDSLAVHAPYRGDGSAQHVAQGGSLAIYTDSGRFRLTRSIYLSGLQLYCTERSISPQDVYDFHDADVADAVLQYALFGEAVYG